VKLGPPLFSSGSQRRASFFLHTAFSSWSSPLSWGFCELFLRVHPFSRFAGFFLIRHLSVCSDNGERLLRSCLYPSYLGELVFPPIANSPPFPCSKRGAFISSVNPSSGNKFPPSNGPRFQRHLFHEPAGVRSLCPSIGIRGFLFFFRSTFSPFPRMTQMM